MKIVLYQQDIVWADLQANRQKLIDLMGRAPGADLYVLPEMFTTGFATSPEGIAEQSPSDTLTLMQQLAARYDAAIAGSIALHEDGRYVNRFLFVRPDGSYAAYDKRHLFTYGGEHKTFTGGSERVIVEWRGVRFLLLVCYDLRFPVWIRNRRDYDAILCIASWPTVRRNAWDTLVRARAIENQCFVAAVDRTGDDPACHYNGGTVFVDPYGEVQAACADGREEFVCAELDMDILHAFRAKFPVLSDADDFSLNVL